MFNSFGNIFRLTSFGESHGPGVGGVIDGFPAGIDIDMDFVQKELNRRRPGQSLLTTSRKEPDTVEFLSGIFDGKSTGCPIGFVVWNKNQHSNDYENIKNLFRPSHADYTYMEKYGIRDYRGGGRSSARETISRVVAGSLAKLALKQLGISVTAYTSQVGPIKLDHDYKSYDLDLIESNDVRCPDLEKAKEMAELIWKVKGEGDTIGGVISCVIKGCPIGLGQPVFGKLHAALGNAMLSINAVKGFAYGQGFDSMELRGSEQNDVFYNNGGRIETKTNYSGGICGQPVSFFRIICHHRLDEADRSNGNQIVEIIGQALILFHNVRDQAQIPLDQNVSGFCIAPLIRIQTAFFFLCRQWF